MKKVFLHYTEGCCWRRVLDTEMLKTYFSRNGCTLTKNEKEADYIVLCTCSFVKSTEDISVNEINMYKECPGELIVTGCIPGINPKRLKTVFQGKSIAAKDIEEIDSLFPDFKIRFKDIEESNNLFQQKLLTNTIYKFTKKDIISFLFKHGGLNWDIYRKVLSRLLYIRDTHRNKTSELFHIRIGRGCGEPHCSFCVEWMAVGDYKSKPLDSCLHEFECGLNQGYKYFSLVADDPGAYGVDIGETFSNLLRKMHETEKEFYITSIDGLNPSWIIKYLDELLPIFRQRKIKFVMSPLQSGSDKMLKLMNRPYTRADALNAFLKLKEAAPDLGFLTQLVVGFPSETEEDFDDSISFIKKMDPFQIRMFPYYKNPLTPSAKIKPEISPEVALQRIARAKIEFGKQGIFYL